MKTTCAVRPALASDWRAIRSLLEENQLPLAGAREHLPDFLVATVDGVVAGCAGLEVYGEFALLRSVAIASLLKRRGIGDILIGRLLQEASQRGLTNLYLLTLTAETYFAKRGFARLALESAPESFKASAEFQGACPDSAVFMSLSLDQTRA